MTDNNKTFSGFKGNAVFLSEILKIGGIALQEKANELKTHKNDQELSIKDWAITIALSTIVVILIRVFVLGVAIVEGPSMENTIFEGEKVVYFKMLSPEVDDIVIVDTETGSRIIKRVIALEGDTVEIKDGILYVNGEKKEEEYIKEPMMDTEYEKIEIGEGEIFVMGDNRNVSADSRWYGTFDLDDQYVGKVVLTF